MSHRWALRRGSSSAIRHREVRGPHFHESVGAGRHLPSADGEGHVRDCLIQLASRGLCAEAVAAELNVQTTKGDASFIHHVSAEVVGPAGHQSLAERRDVEEVARGAVIAKALAGAPLAET